MTYEELKQDAVDHVREGYKHHPAFFLQWNRKIADLCKAYDKEHDELNKLRNKLHKLRPDWLAKTFSQDSKALENLRALSLEDPETLSRKDLKALEDLRILDDFRKKAAERFPAMLHPIDAAFGEFDDKTGTIKIQIFANADEAGPVYMMALLTLHDTRDGCTRITDWPESWLTRSKNNFIESFGDKSDFVQSAIDYLETALAELSPGKIETEKRERKTKSGVADTCEHAFDFRSITWFGQPYTFNSTQARIIKILWESPEPLHQNTIAAAINSYANKYRLVDSFRQRGEYHPAWGKVIKHLGRGIYTLAKPEQKIP